MGSYCAPHLCPFRASIHVPETARGKGRACPGCGWLAAVSALLRYERPKLFVGFNQGPYAGLIISRRGRPAGQKEQVFHDETLVNLKLENAHAAQGNSLLVKAC